VSGERATRNGERAGQAAGKLDTLGTTARGDGTELTFSVPPWSMSIAWWLVLISHAGDIECADRAAAVRDADAAGVADVKALHRVVLGKVDAVARGRHDGRDSRVVGVEQRDGMGATGALTRWSDRRDRRPVRAGSARP
jgi:hypothetical protein